MYKLPRDPTETLRLRASFKKSQMRLVQSTAVAEALAQHSRLQDLRHLQLPQSRSLCQASPQEQEALVS